jgi:hypothetical protein
VFNLKLSGAFESRLFLIAPGRNGTLPATVLPRDPRHESRAQDAFVVLPRGQPRRAAT